VWCASGFMAGSRLSAGREKEQIYRDSLGSPPSLVMKGSAVRVRASAFKSRKSLHIGVSCCLGRRGKHNTVSEGVLLLGVAQIPANC